MSTELMWSNSGLDENTYKIWNIFQQENNKHVKDWFKSAGSFLLAVHKTMLLFVEVHYDLNVQFANYLDHPVKSRHLVAHCSAKMPL